MIKKPRFQAASCLVLISITSIFPYGVMARPAKLSQADSTEIALSKACATEATDAFFLQPRRDQKTEDFVAELANVAPSFEVFDSQLALLSVALPDNAPASSLTVQSVSDKSEAGIGSNIDVTANPAPVSTPTNFVSAREILFGKKTSSSTRFNNNNSNSIEFGISTGPSSQRSYSQSPMDSSIGSSRTLTPTPMNRVAPISQTVPEAQPLLSSVLPSAVTPVISPSLFGDAALSSRQTNSQNSTGTSDTANGAAVSAGEPLIYDNDLVGSAVVEKKDLTNSQRAAATAESLIAATVSGSSSLVMGTRLPVQMLSSHYSKSAVIGDVVEARLLADVQIGGNLMAPCGSKVIGRVVSCDRANKFAASLNGQRKMRMGASVGLQFDAIVTPAGTRIAINAKPASQARFIENKNTGRILSISGSGNISPPTSSQLKAQGFTMALRAGASAAGPISFGAVPVGFGIMGAIAPSLFMLRPVGANEPHRRLKGFGLGVLNGLPGGFVVADCFVKGGEVAILPGDRMMAELKTELSPDVVLSEQVAIDARKDVHGNVVTR